MEENKLLSLQSLDEIKKYTDESVSSASSDTKNYVDETVANATADISTFVAQDLTTSIDVNYHTKEIDISDSIKEQLSNYVLTWTNAELDINKPIRICFGRYKQGGQGLIESTFYGMPTGMQGTSGKKYIYYSIEPYTFYNASDITGRFCYVSIEFWIKGDAENGYTLNTSRLSAKVIDSPYALSSDILAKNNTTSYTPTADYHPSTKKYVDDSIINAISGISSFSLLPVDALPTEDIQTNIIYAVPSKNPKTENEREEYVYINEKWECLGTTNIDLSNYYTKEEIEQLLPNTSTEGLPVVVVGDGYEDRIVELINEHKQKYFPDADRIPSTSSNFAFILQGVTGSGPTTFIVSLNSQYNTSDRILLCGGAVYRADNGYIGNADQPFDAASLSIVILGSWTDGVFTKSNFSLRTQWDRLIGIYNDSQWTPNNDYSPASKKYVDDAIKNIDIPDASASLTSQVYQLTLTEALPTSGRDLTSAELSSLQTILSSIAETGDTTALIQVWVKKDYVLGFITPNTYYENYSTWYDCILKTISNLSFRGHLQTHKNPADTNWSLFNVSGTIYGSYNSSTKKVTLTRTHFQSNANSHTYSVMGFTNKTKSFVTSSSVLTRTNTSEFTPTGDYNPATKKYVDDAVASIDIPESGTGSGLDVVTIIDAGSNDMNLKSGFDMESNAEAFRKIINGASEQKIPVVMLYTCKGGGAISGAPSYLYYPRVTADKWSDGSGGLINLEFDTIYTDSTANSYGAQYQQLYTYSIRINWDGATDTFSVGWYTSKSYFLCLQRDKFISTTNTVEYTPTADYHPATKKYVDDNLANAGGEGGGLPERVYSIISDNVLIGSDNTDATICAQLGEILTDNYNIHGNNVAGARIIWIDSKDYLNVEFRSKPGSFGTFYGLCYYPKVFDTLEKTLELKPTYTSTMVDGKKVFTVTKFRISEITVKRTATDPTEGNQIATKNYVDTAISSINVSGGSDTAEGDRDLNKYYLTDYGLPSSEFFIDWDVEFTSDDGGLGTALKALLDELSGILYQGETAVAYLTDAALGTFKIYINRAGTQLVTINCHSVIIGKSVYCIDFPTFNFTSSGAVTSESYVAKSSNYDIA